jgi:hypothetical protein
VNAQSFRLDLVQRAVGLVNPAAVHQRLMRGVLRRLESTFPFFGKSSRAAAGVASVMPLPVMPIAARARVGVHAPQRTRPAPYFSPLLIVVAPTLCAMIRSIRNALDGRPQRVWWAQVLDSPFARLRELMVELAEEQKLPIPRAFMRMALSMMKRSVRRRAGFNIDDVSPLDAAPQAFIPALFGARGARPRRTRSCPERGCCDPL